MADRYWVGGTATWDNTAGTKWALTSGGAGGQAVPTSADDVFFDGGSGVNTVTITGFAVNAKSINCTGFTGTITGISGITVAGSITLVAGQTYTHSGTVTITGTGTLTTAGKTFGAVTVNGSGITVTLGDALSIGNRQVTVTQGTFDTSNYNVTGLNITSNNSNTRTITLGSSTLTLSGSPSIDFTTSTNLTFNANTSQINIPNANGSIIGGGKTFYNVSFNIGNVGTRSITGANTFNDLSLIVNTAGISTLQLLANQTVNGTFTCAGTSAINRGFVRSDTIGTTRTITANAISANDCDFRDITLAGTASGASPTRAGDCGNNSGITFPASKTVYWNLAGTQNWNATAWATTSTGTPAVNNFPLAQDTATFTNGGSAGTIALGLSYNTGTIDASGRTSAMTLNHNAAHNIYGSYTLASGVTVSGTSGQTFAGRGTQTFTSAAKTITFPITVDKPAGAFELGDATTTSSSITLTQGTFDAKNYNLTCLSFRSDGSLSRTITMGSGLWTLSGSGTSVATRVWNLSTTTNLVLNKDTANFLLSSTATAEINFWGGSLTYNKLTISGATGNSTTVIRQTDTFSEIASTKPVAHTISFTTNTTTIGTWTVTGTAGNVVTVNNTTPGSRRTINLTNATSGIDYLSVTDIGVTTTDKFYVGANSTDGGNNLNVYFTAAPTPTANGNFFFMMGM